MRCCVLLVCLLLRIGVQNGWSRPVKSDLVTFPGNIVKNPADVKLAESYLKRFGYMEAVQRSGFKSKVSIEKALKRMQRQMGLKETGKLDWPTLTVMKKPRCGVPDVANYNVTAGEPKWGHTDITYRLHKISGDMFPNVIGDVVARAFKVWSDVIPLTFTRLFQGPADIMISFEKADHGDQNPFDGKNGVLAHAYPPGVGIGGDAHFDDDEYWTQGKGAVVKTYGGNAGHALCHFPFIYGAISYTTCITVGVTNNLPWCATTPNYNTDRKFGNCPSELLYTVGGNGGGSRCVYPFIFQGRIYKSCTTDGRTDGKRWCATTSNFDTDKKYGFCPKRDTAVIGGNSDGEACFFPFVFQGMNYHSCTSNGRTDGKLWCATTDNYDRDQRWGYCPIRDPAVIMTSPDGDPCHFPFVFQGMTYGACTTVNRTDGRYWCATTSNYTADKKSGFCTDQGFSLFLVAVHEFGHSLGLDHSTIRESIMYPTYRYVENFSLDQDDIDGILYLYGNTTGPGPTLSATSVVTASPIVDPTNDPCKMLKFDTITVIQKHLHFFKDGHFWKVSSKRDVGRKGPFSISQIWPALPAVIDSAFEDVQTTKIYFFSGTRFWVYTGSSVVGPHGIEKFGLPPSVQKVEGALYRGKSKVLLFSGENFWRFDLKTQMIDKGYPRYTDTNFGGVPNDAHDVFQHKGNIYFCRDLFYWRLNSHRQVEHTGNVKYDLLYCQK